MNDEIKVENILDIFKMLTDPNTHWNERYFVFVDIEDKKVQDNEY